jgi:hypothetical protein
MLYKFPIFIFFHSELQNAGRNDVGVQMYTEAN